MEDLLNIEQLVANFYKTIKGFFKVLFLSKFYAKTPKVGKSEECVILCSGPSLIESIKKYKEKFVGKKLLVVNHFPETEYYEELEPSFLVLLNRKFWEYDKSISSDQKYLNLFEALITKTTWPITVCIDAKAKGKLDWITEKNSNVSFIYFNKNGIEGFQWLRFFFWKKALASPRCWNVLIASTFLSVNLGFKKTYVFGADHSWFESLHINEKNETMIKQIHFYDNEEKMNFVPFIHSETKKPVPIQDLMHMYHMVFKEYHEINDLSLIHI